MQYFYNFWPPVCVICCSQCTSLSLSQQVPKLLSCKSRPYRYKHLVFYSWPNTWWHLIIFGYKFGLSLFGFSEKSSTEYRCFFSHSPSSVDWSNSMNFWRLVNFLTKVFLSAFCITSISSCNELWTCNYSVFSKKLRANKIINWLAPEIILPIFLLQVFW